ncbi:MAG: hypothetical protein MJ220_04450 [Bacilli bacterium]|nr:hypothetical protein [Bacilli bacterium]
MKKSRIILPAIALLAVSGIASVTGTVAWFTAAQSTEVSFSSVTAVNTAGDLKFTKVASSEKNCTVSTTTGGIISSFAVEKLTHASYDGENVWTVDAATTNNEDHSGEAYITRAWNKSAGKDGTNDIYYAAQFVGNFQISGNSKNDYALMFSVDDSEMDVTNGIAPAFRMLMEFGTDGYILWNGVTFASSAAYVDGADSTSTRTFTTESANVTAGDPTADATGSSNYIDTLKASTDTGAHNNIDVKFTMWFEGLDAACTNDALKTADTLAGSISFYCVDLATLL